MSTVVPSEDDLRAFWPTEQDVDALLGEERRRLANDCEGEQNANGVTERTEGHTQEWRAVRMGARVTPAQPHFVRMVALCSNDVDHKFVNGSLCSARTLRRVSTEFA